MDGGVDVEDRPVKYRINNYLASRHLEIFLAASQFEFTTPEQHRMSTTLGKRKRAVHRKESARRAESEGSESEQLDAQEIFRRHFEAQFKPLPVVKKDIVMEETPQEESEEDSDWDGISDGEADGVQVVEHTDALSRMAAMSKEELKSFMVFLRNRRYTIRANPLIELEDPEEHSYCIDSRHFREQNRRRRCFRSSQPQKGSCPPAVAC